MQRLIILGEVYTSQVVNANVPFGTLQLFCACHGLTCWSRKSPLLCGGCALSSRDNAWVEGVSCGISLYTHKGENTSESGIRESMTTFQPATL